MAPTNTPRRTNRLHRTFAVGAVLALAAAGCGGDDDTADDVQDVVDDADSAADDVTAEDVEDAADDVVDAADDAADDAEAASADLAETLRDNGLASIAAAVDVIDFEEITDTPEFTFFAPNDDAFTSLTTDEITDLLADPTEVGDVLRNHTVAGRLAASDLTDGMELETEAGDVLVVTIDGDTVKVGEAVVVTTDVEVDDGIVHVVDALIIP